MLSESLGSGDDSLDLAEGDKDTCFRGSSYNSFQNPRAFHFMSCRTSWSTGSKVSIRINLAREHLDVENEVHANLQYIREFNEMSEARTAATSRRLF